MEIDKKNYADYIKEITPVHNLWASMGKAIAKGILEAIELLNKKREEYEYV